MAFNAVQYCCIVQVHLVSIHTYTLLLTTPFPLLDIPKGELVTQETLAINEVGMAIEWERVGKQGREQTGDTNEV